MLKLQYLSNSILMVELLQFCSKHDNYRRLLDSFRIFGSFRQSVRAQFYKERFYKRHFQLIIYKFNRHLTNSNKKQLTSFNIFQQFINWVKTQKFNLFESSLWTDAVKRKYKECTVSKVRMETIAKQLNKRIVNVLKLMESKAQESQHSKKEKGVFNGKQEESKQGESSSESEDDSSNDQIKQTCSQNRIVDSLSKNKYNIQSKLQQNQQNDNKYVKKQLAKQQQFPQLKQSTKQQKQKVFQFDYTDQQQNTENYTKSQQSTPKEQTGSDKQQNKQQVMIKQQKQQQKRNILIDKLKYMLICPERHQLIKERLFNNEQTIPQSSDNQEQQSDYYYFQKQQFKNYDFQYW